MSGKIVEHVHFMSTRSFQAEPRCPQPAREALTVGNDELDFDLARHAWESICVKSYFSRATTNSGAHSKARWISELGSSEMAARASSAYCWARVVAASSEP